MIQSRSFEHSHERVPAIHIGFSRNLFPCLLLNLDLTVFVVFFKCCSQSTCRQIMMGQPSSWGAEIQTPRSGRFIIEYVLRQIES